MEAIDYSLQLNEPQPSTPTSEMKHVDRLGCSCDSDRFNAMGILLDLTLSDARRDRFRPLNFGSCVRIVSQERNQRLDLDAISRVAKIATGLAEAQTKSAMLVKVKDPLKGLRNHGTIQPILLHIQPSNGIYLFGQGSRKRLKTLEPFDTYRMEYLKGLMMYTKQGYDSSSVVVINTFTTRGAEVPNVACVSNTQMGRRQERVPGLQAMCRSSRLYQAIGWNPGWKKMCRSPAIDMVHR